MDGFISQGGESLTDATEIKETEDFTVVTKRQGKKGKKGSSSSAKALRDEIKFLANPAEREETESRKDVLKKIETCIKVLEKSKYYTALVEELESNIREVLKVSSLGNRSFDILCLGLGIFSSHHLIDLSLARFQLALLVLLRRRFQSSVEVFDPVFIPQEKSILTEEYGFKVSEENKEGKYNIDQPTLLFLPHCPHQLVNNLLQHNWKPECLNNCYILANSLLSIALLNLSVSKPKDESLSFISKAQSICTEIPISNEFKENPKVFNEMSLHVFPSQNLQRL